MQLTEEEVAIIEQIAKKKVAHVKSNVKLTWGRWL
jgi:hypothetical protein